MQPFRILEHTADVGFEAMGSTREEVFANAARALVHLMVELNSLAPREEFAINVKGSDPPSLLVNWLNEILYLFDTEGWLFCDFVVREQSDNTISALAHGEKFDRSRHQVKLQVKAITYHQLALEERRGCWRAQVYVDI
jgi:SHS2 domain-containing protein